MWGRLARLMTNVILYPMNVISSNNFLLISLQIYRHNEALNRWGNKDIFWETEQIYRGEYQDVDWQRRRQILLQAAQRPSLLRLWEECFWTIPAYELFLLTCHSHSTSREKTQLQSKFFFHVKNLWCLFKSQETEGFFVTLQFFQSWSLRLPVVIKFLHVVQM